MPRISIFLESCSKFTRYTSYTPLTINYFMIHVFVDLNVQLNVAHKPLEMYIFWKERNGASEGVWSEKQFDGFICNTGTKTSI